MSKPEFYRRARSPGAAKPWRRKDTVTGAVTLDPSFAQAADVGPESDRQSLYPGYSHAGQAPADGAVYPGDGFEAQGTAVVPADSGGVVPQPALQVGDSLDLRMEHTVAHADPVPLEAEKMRRSVRERKESVVLPRHLNGLFHKIMGWAKDLEGDVDTSTGTTDAPSKAAAEADPQLAKQAAARAKNRMQYGLLMDDFDSDEFAKQHNLTVAGGKFEKRFMEWQGVRLLDKSPAEDMAEVRDNKAALIMHAPTGMKIPRLGRDACPGCGATLQDEREGDMGFVSKGEVEQFIFSWQEAVQRRTEYADRMHELQRHWEKHGKRVGEEWLDFMTQDEFNAIHRFKGRPCVCRRCYTLEHFGTTTETTTLTAPDFTEQLKKLREKRCVIVLVVDLTDFPGSMVPDLPGLISMNNPVIIAANKLDCVTQQKFDYNGRNLTLHSTRLRRRHVQDWVLQQAAQFRLPAQQIKAVVPLSAKRGWYIDDLINAIEREANLTLHRPTKPVPTYFVGVTNVGKSSVINAIAHRLYVPEAPHPEAKKVYYTQRDSDGNEKVRSRWVVPPHVNKAEMIESRSRRTKEQTKLLTTSPLPGTTLNAVAVRCSLVRGDKAAETAYLFDTPGLYPHWFESSPFTVQQQAACLQRRHRGADFFVLKPGFTLFVGGAVAIDVVKGPRQILFALYTSAKVKSNFCDTEHADEYWAAQLGKSLSPPGSPEQVGDMRLTVKRNYLFECYREDHRKTPKADIYVCGLGWVSFAVTETADVVLRVRTLPGIVHGVREPLRNRDLRPFRPWPKLPMQRTTREEQEGVTTMVKLTAAPVNPEEPAVREVPKPKPEPRSAASDAPFDFLMEELHRRGTHSKP